jgi:hypothetical protein
MARLWWSEQSPSLPVCKRCSKHKASATERKGGEVVCTACWWKGWVGGLFKAFFEWPGPTP